MAENIIWDNTPIDEIRRNSLELNKINENGTIGEMIDTINSNFQNIAIHGGGPAGVNGVDGFDGVDGTNIEYIYCLCDKMNPGEQYPSDDAGKNSLFERVHFAGYAGYPEGEQNVVWYEHAQPISEEHKNEFVLIRYKLGGVVWSYAEKPILWAHWGENGNDGDGVEYIFLTSNSEYIDDSSLNGLLLKKISMDRYQKAIYQIDDFYPGVGWFIDANKAEARRALETAGASLSTNDFNERWRNYFNMIVGGKSWTDDPTGTTPSDPYEYVAIRRSKTDENGIKEWTDYSKPAIWSHYGLPTRTFIIYYYADEGVTPPQPTGGWWDVDRDILVTVKEDKELTPGWSDHDIEQEGKIAWISSGVFGYDGENISWTPPVRITGAHGEKGEDGALIEFIYTLSDSMVKGVNYPTDKNEWGKIFDTIEDLDNPVEGVVVGGPDSDGIKYVVYNNTHWYDRARSISHEKTTEYVWIRTRNPRMQSESEFGGDEWVYSEPVIWARWGEDGTDGDGIEYIFHTSPTKFDKTKTDVDNPFYRPPKVSDVTDTNMKPYCEAIYQINDFYPNATWFNNNRAKIEGVISETQGLTVDGLNTLWDDIRTYFDKGWTDNPIGPDMVNLYEYVSIRKSTLDGNGNQVWGDFSEPALWSNYNNRTRVFIVYCNTEIGETPEQPSGGKWDVANDTFVTNDSLHPLTPSYWSDTNEDEEGKYTWLASGVFHEDDYVGNEPVWSEPHQITRKGEDGTNNEFIYAICNVTQMYELTHYPSAGTNNANWKTLFNAIEDPNSVQVSDLQAANLTTGTDDDGVPYVAYTYNGKETRWYDRALSISEDNRVEFCWERHRMADDPWEYDLPFIWAHWGEDGTDGDGVEYIFSLSPDVNNFSNWSTNANVDSLTEYEQLIYNVSDFLPNSNWFTNNQNKIKEIIQGNIEKEGLEFNESTFNTAWNSLKSKFSFNNKSLGTWTDNPQNITAENPYQYVSIRKSPKGKYGEFSEPKLWSKYNVNKFTSFVFTSAGPDENLSNVTPTGGSYSNPKPTNPSGFTWTDGPTPTATKPIVWMTSANFLEGYTPGSNETYPKWSKLQKMSDSNEFNVEWSTDDLTNEQVNTLNNNLNDPAYNLISFITTAKNNPSNDTWEKIEEAAEEAWRNKVQTDFGFTFSDNAAGAVLMATCQFKNSEWTNWKVSRVKGEQGPQGNSINVHGAIKYEVYFDDETTYNYTSANTARSNATFEDTPVSGDLLIVYPKKKDQDNDDVADAYWGDNSKGGCLYIWKCMGDNTWEDYNNLTTYQNNESANNAYSSPNGHLIIWDGDSWQDIGKIHGPVGPATKILIAFANEGTNGKVLVTDDNDIPFAKWIGFVTYTEGEEDPETFTNNLANSRWIWSLFKGQDGYGYEFIYKGTSNNNAPNVPNYDNPNDKYADDVKPTGWDDDPIEPDATDNRYIWMCWRKYDKSEGEWTQYYGAGGLTSAENGKARLWQVYANSVNSVSEYFHADVSMTPSFPSTSDISSSAWSDFWHSKGEVVGNENQNYKWGLSRKYLFNIEVVTFSDGSVNVLDPHFVSMWEDGIIDIQDYYILESKENNNNDPGEVAPHVTNGIPKTTGSGSETAGKDYWVNSFNSVPAMNLDYPVLWNVSYKTYNGGKNPEWTTPLVIGVYGQGAQGDNAVYIDLSNEMDTVPVTKEDGKNIYKGDTLSLQTEAVLYGGLNDKLVLSDIDISGANGITVTKEYYCGNSKINGVTDNTMQSNNIDKVVITFTINTNAILPNSTSINIGLTSADGVSRITTYKLNTIQYEARYEIITAPKEIIFNSNTNTYSSNTISVTVRKFNSAGQYDYAYAGGDPDSVLYYQKNNETAVSFSGRDPFSVSVSTLNLGADDKVTFTLMVDADSDPNDNDYETIIDQETVYVLLHGSDGNSIYRKYARYTDSWGSFGSIVSISSDGSTVTFKTANNVTQTASTTNVPNGADEDHCIEVMSEKIGTSGTWSFPVIIARQFSDEEIESKVNAALTDSNQTLVDFINQTAGQAISTSLAGYATTEDLSIYVSSGAYDFDSFASTGDLENYISQNGLSGILASYVTNVVFTSYQSDASNKIAVAETIAANAVFYQDGGGYYYTSNRSKTSASDFTSLMSLYFYSLSSYQRANLGYQTFASLLLDSVAVSYLINGKSGITAFSVPGMKATYKTTYSELAAIKASVGEGVSAVTIAAAISSGHSTSDDNTAKNAIAATIFAEANKNGSNIGINANNVSINSDHFTLDNSGLTFNVGGGKTQLLSDGTLYATNAVIAGNITTNTLSATSTITQPSVSITKDVTINGSEFLMRGSGVIGNNAFDNTLQLTIVSTVQNENPDLVNPDTNTMYDTLYGVPTLTFTYNGQPFILSPGCWINQNADHSDMAWVRDCNLRQYTVKSSLPTSTGSTTVSSKNITYYIVKNENEIVNPDTEIVLYKFIVYALGTNPSQRKTWITNNNLATNSTDIASINNTAAYTKMTNIAEGQRGHDSSNPIHITSANCSTFNSYLLTSEISGGPVCYKYNSTSNQQITSDFGMERIFCDSMYKLGYGGEWNTDGYNFEAHYSGYGGTDYYCNGSEFKSRFISFDSASNSFLNMIPFNYGSTSSSTQSYLYSGTSINQKTYSVSITAYPLITFSNYGRTKSNINKIWVNCSYSMVLGGFSGFTGTKSISISSYYNGFGSTTLSFSEYYYPILFTVETSFSVLLSLTNGLTYDTDYNMSNIESKIIDIIKNTLTNCFNGQSVGGSKFYNMKTTATFMASCKHSGQSISIANASNVYGSGYPGAVIFTITV